jgi:hypothetical protein
MPNQKLISKKLCPVCKFYHVAVNYHRHGKVYYRAMCTSCIHKGKKIKPEAPNWYKSGYRKKEKCDRCGFKFKFLGQANVYYTDGNKNNINWSNLKTICLNCQVEVENITTSWIPGKIIPDF